MTESRQPEFPRSTPAPLASGPLEGSHCWNRSGVFGKADCAELNRFLHCRNCPVYSTASFHLLSQPLSREYREEAAVRLSKPKDSPPPSNASALLFSIRSESFGINTTDVQEISEPRSIHSLPHRRHGIVLGIVNIRGELLTCISLGHLLGIPGTPAHASLRLGGRRLVVVHTSGGRIAFPVDQIYGVHRFHTSQINLPPATVARATNPCTIGTLKWRDVTVALFNIEALVGAVSRRLS